MSKNIIYCNGIYESDTADQLKLEWDNALFGQSNPNSYMAYWSDLVPQTWGVTATPGFIKWIAGIPNTLLDHLTKVVTDHFLKDVYLYFYDEATRDAIRARFITTVENHTPEVVVAHSLGTVIAYDCLKLRPDLKVPTLITLGSPLALIFVLAHEHRTFDDLKQPGGVTNWHNFLDRLDLVTCGQKLSLSYPGTVTDKFVTNMKSSLIPYNPKNHHEATGYLALPSVKDAVAIALS